MARIPALLKWSLTSVLIGLHCSVPLHASSTENTANLLRIALPVSGWAMTRYYADQDGETQFYKSFAATVLSSYALKIPYIKVDLTVQTTTLFHPAIAPWHFRELLLFSADMAMSWGYPHTF